MVAINRVMLAGNLTRTPEIKYAGNGTAICNFGLAVNNKYKTRDGEEKEDVLFADITVFGRQAETTSEYLDKGSPVFIEGRLKLDQWTTQEGQKRSKLSVIADRVQFLGGKSDGGGGGGSRAAQDGDTGRDAGDKPAPDDDDIPF